MIFFSKCDFPNNVRDYEYDSKTFNVRDYEYDSKTYLSGTDWRSGYGVFLNSLHVCLFIFTKINI